MSQVLSVIRSRGQQSWKILFALLSLYLIWGSAYLAVDIALDSFPPFTLMALRCWIAGSLMLVFAFSQGESLPAWPLTRNAILIGCLLLGFGPSSVAVAEQWVSTGLTALGIAAVPLWTAIFAALLIKRPSRNEWLGLIIGFSGIILLNLDQRLQAEPLGAFALILGPVCWSFGSILSQRLKMPTGWMALAIELLGAAAFLTIARTIFGETLNSPPTFRTFGAILYMALLGSLVGFTSYMYLLRTVRPALATSYAYINPLVAVALGIIFLGEVISSTLIIAMLVILTGVAIVVLARANN